MKPIFVETNNVLSMKQAMERLEARDSDTPGLGLIHGEAGLGKTKSIIWYAATRRCIYLRGKATWSATWMLEELCFALGEYPGRKIAETFQSAIRSLEKQRCPVFIDEANYLLRDSKLLETVRDLHDLSGVPFVVVGMENIERRLAKYHQFSSRISERVSFEPLLCDEIVMLAKVLCELKLAHEGAVSLQKDTNGNFREVIVCLDHLEKQAKTNKITDIDKRMVDATVRVILNRRVSK